jgi:hypothetical protein
MGSPRSVTASCLAALLLLPLAAGARNPASGWLLPIPASGRASLLSAVHQLMFAEAHQDWSAVYRLRPALDRETETEEQFTQRWKEISPDPVLDFEPLRTIASTFAGVSEDEQVFDVLGCALVDRGSKMGEKGSISAHLQGGTWYLDGVHVLTDDVGRPEPCRFDPDRGVLAVPPKRH